MDRKNIVQADDLESIKGALKAFAGIDDDAFELSRPFWLERHYKKGEFYNEYKNVCKHLGFIMSGIFRTYYVNGETGEQKNVFFCSEQQLIVSYKSFVEQSPCNYHTEAMLESRILYIHINHLQELYRQSHHWERFGRLVAEAAFAIAMSKAESFMFGSAEDCYRELITQHRNITERIPLYHIASYLGIQGPSLSRIRKKLAGQRF
jgi:CRP-like cAMP-binding protein